MLLSPQFPIIHNIAVVALKTFLKRDLPEPDHEVAPAYIQKYDRLHDRGRVVRQPYVDPS